MKISASIYSDKKRDLTAVIEDLQVHQVDMLHVDCNDDPSVFEDIELIRSQCNLPIDLHIITSTPETYFDLLRKHPVEYITFQYEDLSTPLAIPEDISGKKGLAIITPTNIAVFEAYEHFDFILIMATVPGQSGGVFDRQNFKKIRDFRKKYPNKSIHVDGGVNGEVSFILRNMGVSSSVSGSYLFNAPSIGHALMNLTKRDIESNYRVCDFMTPIEECPVVQLDNLGWRAVLETIERGNLGFALVVEAENKFVGLIATADIRKLMLKHLDDLNSMNVSDALNRNPIHVLSEQTVIELLQVSKSCAFPVMYFPVLNNQRDAVGIVNFTNLIKAEI